MLHRMAIILHQHGTLIGKFTDELVLRSCGSKGSLERLARQPELVWLSIMRSSKNNKSALAEVRSECLVSRLVALPSALRTYMRRRNSDYSLRCRFSRTQVPLHEHLQRPQFRRIG